MESIQEERFKNLLIINQYLKESDLVDLPKTTNLLDFICKNKLVDYNLVSELLNRFFGIKTYKLSHSNINKDIVKSIFDYDFVKKYNIMPFDIIDNKLHIVMSNPLDDTAYEDTKIISGYDVEVYFSYYEDINFFINYFFNNENLDSITEEFIEETNEITEEISNIEENIEVEEAPITKIIDTIIDSSIFLNASDIHIEPFEDIIRIRFRIDGHLETQNQLDKKMYSNIISRLKIMSGMDISITKLPQDGYLKLKKNGVNVDLRFSTLPTFFGEKFVIRIIYPNKSLDFINHELGFFDEDIIKIKNILKNNSGVIFVTGPTGSGKTTTLNSFISYLNKENVNIITVEDPIENSIHGVNHVLINSKINIYFNNILRNILRHDPDIIMIGEIRDEETANITIQSATTGHLVLTTLHTNDSITTIHRLLEMNIKPYLITSVVKGIISQRLVRRLCNHCKEKIKVPPYYANLLKLSTDENVYKAVGCEKCRNTGYSGRFVIYEILEFDKETRKIIDSTQNIDILSKRLKKYGFSTMQDNAIKNVLLGNTSLEEICNVLYTN